MKVNKSCYTTVMWHVLKVVSVYYSDGEDGMMGSNLIYNLDEVQMGAEEVRFDCLFFTSR